MTATAAAIVPVKQLAAVKSRLAGRLSLPERRELVLSLLRHSLSVLGESQAISSIIVVTPDDEVAREASCRGAGVLRQKGEGINAAIRLGLDAARERGERYCLVLLADLPLLEVDDIGALVDMAGPETLALAPDRHEQGTNALVTDLADDFKPAFGEGSLADHRQQGLRRGWAVPEYYSPGTALDLDTPDDLDEYAQHVGSTDDPDEWIET